MDDDLGQAGDPLQAACLVQISKDRTGAPVAPESELLRVAYQCEDAVVAEEVWQQTAGNISTADDQKFLHCAILPESDISGDSMAFQVSIQPSQHRFQARPDETILEAALRQ